MTKVSATKLRSHLFDYLNEVSRGKSMLVERNGKVVGKIVPIQSGDWRKRMTVKARLKTSDKKAFAPLKDVWKEYL